MPQHVAVDEEGEPGILAGTRRNPEGVMSGAGES
jgi:hypothetical protein